MNELTHLNNNITDTTYLLLSWKHDSAILPSFRENSRSQVNYGACGVPNLEIYNSFYSSAILKVLIHFSLYVLDSNLLCHYYWWWYKNRWYFFLMRHFMILFMQEKTANGKVLKHRRLHVKTKIKKLGDVFNRWRRKFLVKILINTIGLSYHSTYKDNTDDCVFLNSNQNYSKLYQKSFTRNTKN